MTYRYYMKKNVQFIFLLTIVLCVFFFHVMQGELGSEIVHTYWVMFNERRFLSIYLSLFLCSLIPYMKRIFCVDYVTRFPSKWVFLEKLCLRIFLIAIIYSLLLTFGWYGIVGPRVGGENNAMFLKSLAFIFLGNMIGWMEVGLLEVFLYSLIHNVLLAFVFCYAGAISMNLSLYTMRSEQFTRYIRLYDFMYHPEIFKTKYDYVSVTFFHIVVIFLIFLLCHERIKRHDYVKGGKCINERQKE